MAGTGEDLPGAAAEALASPRPCPHCAALSVIYDYTQGISACEECGHVVGAADLVPQRFPSAAPGTAPSGVFVPGKDSGVGTARAMLGSGRSVRLLGARPDAALHRLGRPLAALADALALPPPVRRQAEACAERLKAEGVGNWRAEDLVAAATYFAIRSNNLPLTLLDVAGAAQADVFAVGRSYRAACVALGADTPAVNPADLLPRLVARVLANSGGGSEDRVRADAAAALQWMQRHLVGGSGHPIVAAAAAIVLALDMNHMEVGPEYVTNALHVSPSALGHRLRRVREALLRFGGLLPYGAGTLTAKNVLTHARSIMRVTNVLERKKEGEAGEEGGEAAAAAPGPAAAALMAAQVAAKKAEDAAPKPPKAKRRKKASKEEAEEGGETEAAAEKEKEATAVAAVDDLAATIPDAEMHRYLRSAPEVELYKEVYDALHRK